jgi:hypothetical protein
MGGHDGPDRLTRHIHGRLEANIVALGAGEDTIVLVAVDTLFAGAALTDHILRACAARFGVGPERVLVLASHTHTAPMLDAAKPGLGRTEPDELARWSSAIAEAVRDAPIETAASIRVGLGQCDLAVNRRLRWRMPTVVRLLGKVRSDVYMCDNPAGPRDPRIRTAAWLAADGRPLAILWSFACHPSGFNVPDTASPDYVGVVREALRERLGVGLPVIFAPGCMGDVRPRSPRSWKRLDRVFQLLVYGPQSASFDPDEWEAWAAGVANAVVETDQAGETRPVTGLPEALPMVREPMAEIIDGAVPAAELHLKGLDIPGFGRIVAISCEPVTGIARLIGADQDDLVLGYEGDVFGYLPTDAIIAEGGYEAERFMSHFSVTGSFRPGLDARIARLGRALLDRDRTEVG